MRYADLAVNQLAGIDHLVENPRAALWKDIGLGKTVTALTAIDIQRQRFDIHRTLVVAPQRIARSVWTREISKWDHLRHLSCIPILGDRSRREKLMETPADIHTISFQNFVWLVDHFKRKGESRMRRPWPWDCVVIDESSGFKNRDTQRWKAMRRIVRETGTFYELTGSPAPNGYLDIWAPLYLLDLGERLGTTLTGYRDRWFSPPEYNRFRWTIREGAEDEINGRIADLVLAMRADDYIDLPEIMSNVIPVKLPAPQAKEYRHMERELWLELDGHDVTAVNRGVLFQKLLQLANGAIYTDKAGHWAHFHNAKLDVLQELVSDSLALARPVMIIHHFRSDYERIQTRMAQMGVNYRLLKTVKDEDDWNNGKLDALGLHPAGGGHGLNLQDGGETVIWFGLNPSWELYTQANGRLAGGRRRLGKNIRIHHLVTEDTLDVDVMALVEQKGLTEGRLFDALRTRLSSARPTCG